MPWEAEVLVANILAAKGRKVITTWPHQTLAETAALLTAHNIGAAVVLNAQGDIAGIISERDILRAIGTSGPASLHDPVSKHMRTPVLTTHEDEYVHAVMETMTNRRCRHLPVMNGGTLTGIVSIGDVVKHRLEEIEQEHKALREYIATA
jgi:CBS domain-containing protein